MTNLGHEAQQLAVEIISLGGDYVGEIGSLPHGQGGFVGYHAFVLNGRGLIVGDYGDKAGLYEFRGADGEPIDRDLERIREIGGA
jgi:hypothetical protein